MSKDSAKKPKSKCPKRSLEPTTQTTQTPKKITDRYPNASLTYKFRGSQTHADYGLLGRGQMLEGLTGGNIHLL